MLGDGHICFPAAADSPACTSRATPRLFLASGEVKACPCLGQLPTATDAAQHAMRHAMVDDQHLCIKSKPELGACMPHDA